jgi:DNA-binding MarR family transcriptional regulator
MVESHSLSLAFLLGEVHDALVRHVAEGLAERGHARVTAPALGFLGQLDCGINYAAGIADRLGVSRQMVAKTVAEMERAGWLEQDTDPRRRNRKVIRFTPEGERLMADARQVLADLDAQLARDCGSDFLPDLTHALRSLKSRLAPHEG